MRIAGRLAALVTALSLTACMSPENPPTTTPTTHTAKSDVVLRVVQNVMAAEHLKSAIVRVTIDGKEVVTSASGESMTGVPATTDMHFRNGAVAISYVATLLLRLVDEKKVSLDDKLSKYLPDVPHADRVTLRQLA
jgi:CubicO group peptidase (beta-lactamase class C family)